MSRVGHFEIHSSDPQSTIQFYQKVFGWTFTRWEGGPEYWLIQTGPKDQPGIDGGLIRRKGGDPADGQAVNAYVCTIVTSSVDHALAQVAEAGGQVAVPKMAIPGVGWLAYAKDPAGNIFGIMNDDPRAG